MTDNMQTLWLLIIAATVDLDNASNARVRGERNAYRNGLISAYSAITGEDEGNIMEKLYDAIQNLDLEAKATPAGFLRGIAQLGIPTAGGKNIPDEDAEPNDFPFNMIGSVTITNETWASKDERGVDDRGPQDADFTPEDQRAEMLAAADAPTPAEDYEQWHGDDNDN